MFRSGTLVFPLLLVVLSSCGPAAEPAASPSGGSQPLETPTETPPAAPAGAETSDAPAAPAGAEAAPPAAAQSESESLARDFLKSGGRRIGYSATKKLFAYPSEQRRADGFRLDIVFAGEDGRQRDVMQVCDFAECAEKLDEIAKNVAPKLSSRLEGDGYVAIRGIGWPSGRDELEVSSLGMKLRYTKGRLERLNEGKPAASIGQIKGADLLAIFVVPDSKLLAVFAKPTGDTTGVVQQFHVFKLP
jgi:hypothetical protein